MFSKVIVAIFLEKSPSIVETYCEISLAQFLSYWIVEDSVHFLLLSFSLFCVLFNDACARDANVRRRAISIESWSWIQLIAIMATECQLSGITTIKPQKDNEIFT